MRYKVKKEWFIRKMEAIMRDLTLLDEMAKCEFISEATIDRVGRAIDTATDILVEVMGESKHDENSWILYWLYDINCGKDADNGAVVDRDGNPVPLATLEDLWNVIVKEHKDGDC